MRLQNKVAIITGAVTGIGEATAHKFAREGARLVVSGFPTDPVMDVAEAMLRKAVELAPDEAGYHRNLAMTVGYQAGIRGSASI